MRKHCSSLFSTKESQRIISFLSCFQSHWHLAFCDFKCANLNHPRTLKHENNFVTCRDKARIFSFGSVFSISFPISVSKYFLMEESDSVVASLCCSKYSQLLDEARSWLFKDVFNSYKARLRRALIPSVDFVLSFKLFYLVSHRGE